MLFERLPSSYGVIFDAGILPLPAFRHVFMRLGRSRHRPYIHVLFPFLASSKQVPKEAAADATWPDYP